MARLRQVKTTFTAGEVSRDLLGRGDLRAYENGALSLRNVFIQPTGGVARRAGLAYIDTIPGTGRLIAFEFSTEQTYLLVLTDQLVTIYAGSTVVATLAAPWSADQIDQVVWTQSADTLLLVHPEVRPRKITRNSGGTWAIEPWQFFTDENIIHQPLFKFADAEATLTPDGTSGTVTLTSSAPVFEAGHVGIRLRIRGKEAEVTSFDSPTVITAQMIEDLPDTSATIDWQEAAFSPVRGYPASVAFHQDRLVIGGSRDLPNRLWFSKSGDLFNFDTGTGLDDEAIEFAILSDQVNAIRGVFSSRHLQVFTSGAEWMVTGDPLTPATVQIRRQTRVGSSVDRYIPPVNIDGATLFVARNGEQIQEFLYTDIEQAYQATDLALLSRHLINAPVDQDFDQRRRLLFLIRADGRFATLTLYRAEQVAAWTLQETDGEVLSVAVAGESVFFLIRRGGIITIEQLDESLQLDSALTGTDSNGASIWSGLDHLEGRTVQVVADGVRRADKVVNNAGITLDEPATDVQIGLAYTHIVEPLPPSAISSSGSGRAARLVEGLFRLENTATLRLDTGRGLRDVHLRDLGGAALLDAPPPRISGDVRVRAFGWRSSLYEPLWRIEQDSPYPFTLLSVTTEIKVND